MSRPTKGPDNWKKHWKGKGNIETTVKRVAAYFDDPKARGRGIGYLQPTMNQTVTYVDSLSQEMESNQSRIAFQFGSFDAQKQVYYVQIDSLRKPRSRYEGIFKPQAFGLANQEFTLFNYISSLKNAIESRSDIKGELQEYLLALVDYAVNGSSPSEFDVTDLPLNQIRNDFGECIGPIYSIKRGLVGHNLGISDTSKIYIPGRPNEPLLDYFIITNNKQIKVSAKSEGVSSNTLKPANIVPLVEQNTSLYNEVRNTTEYQIIKTIDNNSMIMGPIKCAEILGIISSQAANSVSSLYGGQSRIPSPQLFSNVISRDERLSPILSSSGNDYSKVNITLNQISYACEKLVIKYSQQPVPSMNFTSIVRRALSNEIFFVHLSLNGGVPNFSVRKSSGVRGQVLSNLSLRSKHSYDFKKDRLGFAL